MTHCIDLSTELTPIRVTGGDSERFLQAQLTCDISAVVSHADAAGDVAPTQASRAAWCNPKGRIISTLYVAKLESDYWLIVPANLTDKLLARLRLFVMRSNVTFTTDENWLIVGRTGSQHHEMCDMCSQAPWFTLSHSHREFSMATDAAHSMRGHCQTDSARWRAQRINEGEAYVDQQTTESLLPEHLNLDLSDAVSFTKGCYPGQEVVARMHYKGKQKTRLFCATAPGTVALPPGHSITDETNKTIGQIIESVVTDGILTATLTAPADSVDGGTGIVQFKHADSTHAASSNTLTLAKPAYWVNEPIKSVS